MMNTEGNVFAATSLGECTLMGQRGQAISPHHEGICFMAKEKFYLLKLDHLLESAHHSSRVQVPALQPCPQILTLNFSSGRSDAWFHSFTPSLIQQRIIKWLFNTSDCRSQEIK